MMDRTLLTDAELTEKMIQVLMRELGPVETARIVARIAPNTSGKDSVQRHRDFAASVENDDAFFERLWRLMEEENERLASGQSEHPDVEAL